MEEKNIQYYVCWLTLANKYRTSTYKARTPDFLGKLQFASKIIYKY